MGDVINQSTIWKFVGRMSAIAGLVCFPQGSSYRMSLGKLGYGGHLVYLFVCSFMWWLMIWGKRIQVPEKFKGVVGAILFVVLSSISVLYDKYVPGKSDAYTITSYGLFALMSVSLSRKLELGFETGFSSFLLQLFAAQLFKIKWLLLPIALVFCSLLIILRHYPESRSQYSQEQSLLPTNDQENNQGVSNESMNRSPSIGQAPGRSVMPLDSGNQPNREEVPNPSMILQNFLGQDFLRQSLLSTTNNRENNEAESSQAAMNRSPSIGQVPGRSVMPLDSGNQPNREEVPNPSMILQNLLGQDFPRQSLLSATNNHENNETESSQAAMDRSPSIGHEPEGSMMSIDSGNQQNREEVPENMLSWAYEVDRRRHLEKLIEKNMLSLAYEVDRRRHLEKLIEKVVSETVKMTLLNCLMHGDTKPKSTSAKASDLRRRRRARKKT